MAQYDELIGLLKHLLTNRFAPKPFYIRGLLGDGQGKVVVADRPDYNYARFNRSGSEVFEIFNKEVNPVDGWPVLIGEFPWSPGLAQVVGTDWGAYEQSGWGTSIANVSAHAPTHEWPDGQPGSDIVNVYTRALVPGRGYIVTTGTTTIYVNQLEYEYHNTGTIWPGTPGLDLATPITALATGTARQLGIYIDPRTNALGTVTGATSTFTTAFDPPRVNFPMGTIPIARVRTRAHMPGLREDDIRDARRIISFGANGPSGGDLTGAYPTPQVIGLVGYPLSDVAPSEGDVLMWTGSIWKPTPSSVIGGGGTPGPAGTGGGVWPGPGEIKIGTGTYASASAAFSAAVSGNTVKFGEGTFTADDLTIPNGVAVVGTPETTLQTTAQTYALRSPFTGTVSLYDLTINNSQASSQSTAFFAQAGSTVTMHQVKLLAENFGSTLNTGLDTLNATVDMFDCTVRARGTGTSYGLNLSTSSANTGTVTAYGGLVEGTNQDVFNLGTNSHFRQVGVKLVNGLVSSTGYISGEPADTMANSGWVRNSSTGTASVGDVGYLDSAGEYQTTTTANLGNVSWCVVTVGGANGARIGVARSGKLIVNYTGTAPSKGHYLTTSTTGGKAQRSTTMRPDIFAIATAAGASNKVEALLLCNTVHVPVFSTQRIYTSQSHSGTIFSATMNGNASGTSVVYNTPTGNEDSITNAVSPGNYIGKLRLYNSTRTAYALISSVNTSTNTITVTDSADVSGWLNTDAIQVNSPTNTDTTLGENFFEIKITSELPAHTRAIWFNSALSDSGGTGNNTITRFHPLEAFNNAKRIDRRVLVSGESEAHFMYIPLVDGIFTYTSGASGSATKTDNFSSLIAAEVAAP